MQPDLIVYEFSRPRIERLDFSHFLSLYGKPPSGHTLRALMNRFLFCMQGYDDDPREVYFIPEVRRFYRAFHATWPFCLFHLNLDQDGLRTVVLCCLDSLTGVKRDGVSMCGVEFDPLELVRFLADCLPPMNWLCERAGMSEVEIDQRSREIFQYFDLPYDPE